jgi:hypothetical protein
MIRCGHCKGDHTTVAEIRACAIDTGALPGEIPDGLPVGWFRTEEPTTVRFLDGSDLLSPRPYLDATNPLALPDLRWSRP